jgi:hypothetical protein
MVNDCSIFLGAIYYNIKYLDMYDGNRKKTYVYKMRLQLPVTPGN